MFPMPVLMIGTYGEDGTPDVMNAAWGGITLEDEITICIDTSHKTWANIAARKAFTVAFGTADKVAACDYLGLVSGNKTPDKVKKSGFTLTKSEFVDAPVVNELPLVLECELVSMNEENCNVTLAPTSIASWAMPSPTHSPSGSYCIHDSERTIRPLRRIKTRQQAMRRKAGGAEPRVYAAFREMHQHERH